jgi:hypothetical protein
MGQLSISSSRMLDPNGNVSFLGNFVSSKPTFKGRADGSLIIHREWSEFSDKPCPYHFSDEEIRQHQDEATTFNASQEFWESIGGVVSDEGYTSHEDFEKGIEIFQTLRESGLNRLEGEERNEFERQTQWVLNIGA